MLADSPASPPLHLETVLQYAGRSPPARRAQKFPLLISLQGSPSLRSEVTTVKVSPHIQRALAGPFGAATMRLHYWLQRVDPSRLVSEAAVDCNRETLSKVDHWVDPTAMESSFFGYGLPMRVRGLIDLPISREPTYSDLLCTLAESFGRPTRYLELGVSLGKNLVQIVEYLRNAELVGFDIEVLNPVLYEWFKGQGGAETWPTAEESMLTIDSTLRNYRAVNGSRNSFTYVSGDILDPVSWQHLEGRSFNLVFSDALHEAFALQWELDQLCDRDLLDKDFGAMVWDDLQSPAMFHQVRGLRSQLENHLGRPLSTFGFCRLRGWLGQYEEPHVVGIATWGQHCRPGRGSSTTSR